MVVKVVLENGEVLELRALDKPNALLVQLEDGYTLTGAFRLYKEIGNVLCGEEVPYKTIDVHIEK